MATPTLCELCVEAVQPRVNEVRPNINGPLRARTRAARPWQPAQAERLLLACSTKTKMATAAGDSCWGACV